MHSYLLTPINKSNQKAKKIHIFRIEFAQSLNFKVTRNNLFIPWLTLAGPSHLITVAECFYKSNQKLNREVRPKYQKYFVQPIWVKPKDSIHLKIVLSCVFCFAP